VDDRRLLDAVERDPNVGISAIQREHGAQLLGRLVRYALTYDLSQEDAEDVYQEALLRLLVPEHRAELIAAGGGILPWLSRWGRWRVQDLAEARGRELKRMRAAASIPRGGEGSGDGAQLVAELLSELRPRDEQVLRMRYLEGASEEDIAERLTISEGAAKKAAHDARRRFRDRAKLRGLELPQDEDPT
jgi:RNA polymerase sigma-70 factor (ECF subfamily)